MRVLLTGRGSIAQRHVRNLRQLCPGLEVAVLCAGEPGDALQPCLWLREWKDAAAWSPSAVVIAGVSSDHAGQLVCALREGWPCLLEKPVALTVAQLEAVSAAARECTEAASRTVVGCNLRYLPSVQRVASLLRSGEIGPVVRAQFEVGQELRQWRPYRELAGTYSARAEMGGGVVYDLVHEIDMARWLLGPMQVRAAVRGRLGGAGLASDDVHVGLLALANGAPVTIALDYVAQRLVRRFTVVAQHGTLQWDLVAGRAWIERATGVREVCMDPQEFDMQHSYVAEMADWLRGLEDRAHRAVSSLEEGLETARLMLQLAEAAP